MTQWSKLIVALSVMGMTAGTALQADEAADEFEWNKPKSCCTSDEHDFCHKEKLNCFEISLDVIVAKAMQPGLGYALVGDITSATPATVVSPACTYGLGFRLGFEFECGCWDSKHELTYFRSTRAGEVTGSATAPVTPVFSSSALTEQVDEASSVVRQSVITFDSSMGVDLCFRNCIKLRPFMGTRFAQLSLQNTVAYEDGTLGTDTPITEIATASFKGMGLRCGLESKLNVGFCGICLFSECAGSVVAGSATETLNEVQGPASTVVRNVTETYCAGVGMFELKLGACVDCSICDGAIQLSLRAALENQLIVNPYQSAASGYIAPTVISGFSVGASVGF